MAMLLPSVYKDGTATVAANGSIVTGQNTLWLNSLLPGDFFGVHKGFAVRILSVDSNTSLTLANPWPGAAQAAASYEIMLQSDVSRYSEALRQLLEKLNSGNVDALAGLIGAANTLPMFTGAGTMTTVDYANGLALEGLIGSANKLPMFTGPGTMTTVDYANGLAFGGLVGAADMVPYFTGLGTMSLTKMTAVARTLAGKATEAEMRATLGAVTQGGGTSMTASNTNIVRLGWAADSSGLLVQVDEAPQGKLWTDTFVTANPAARRTQLGAQAALGYTPVRNSFTSAVQIGWDNAELFLRATVDVTDLGRIWADHAAGRSLAVNGYQRYPGGVLLQWGTSQVAAPDYRVLFTVAFPAFCRSVAPVADNVLGLTDALSITVSQIDKTGFDVRSRVISNGGAVSGHSNTLVRWMAVGY
jgi:hypothetical protein